MVRVADMLGVRPDTAKQVCGDAFADMPEDEQEFLREEAAGLIVAHRRGLNMPQYFEARHFDTEEKLALWFLLPSDVRSAIKNAKR